MKPLVDIDIQSEISAADEALLKDGSDKEAKQDPKQEIGAKEQELEVGRNDTKVSLGDTPLPEQISPLPPNPL